MRKLRELRKANNLTIAKAAEELNIPFETYRSYEIGRNQADYDTLIKVAKFFGVSVDYLLGQEEDIRTRLAAPVSEGGTTEQERELLRYFRELSPPPTAGTVHGAQASDETRLLEIYRSLSPDMRSTLWSLLETWSPSVQKNKV